VCASAVPAPREVDAHTHVQTAPPDRTALASV
jgi:hypothetical protein